MIALIDQLLNTPEDQKRGPETNDLVFQIAEVAKQNQCSEQYQYHAPKYLAAFGMFLEFRQLNLLF